jgi:serine/threonine-protein kinase
MRSRSGEDGTLFGRYRLLGVIATDAVSTTYYATSDSGARQSRASGADQFAVRVTRRVDPNDEHAVDMARMFLSEAQKAGVVDHPTIVRPHDLGIIDGRPYIATPFVRAVPLRDLLVHGGTINQAAALAMFAQLAGALDAAHRAGIVHGALSPQTIWIGPSAGEGTPYIAYLTGFGTARLLRDRMGATPRGEPLDDVLYVSPEQLRGEAATGASDQYALGCAVYHTMAGRPPYERETRSRLYGAHLLAPPPRLIEEDPRTAPATSDAVQRAMAKDPASRFPSCGVMIHEALPAGRDTAVADHGRARSHRRPARWSGPAGRWVAFALVGAVVVLVVAALWMVLGPGGGTQARDDLRYAAEGRSVAESGWQAGDRAGKLDTVKKAHDRG